MPDKFKDQLRRMRGELVHLANIANLDRSYGIAEKAQAAIGVVAMVENEIEGTPFEEVDTDWRPEPEDADV